MKWLTHRKRRRPDRWTWGHDGQNSFTNGAFLSMICARSS